MCLAIPGRVVRWIDVDPISATAEVEFGAVSRVCHMACVPDAVPGDFVIVHAGVAISILDTDQADRLLTDLAGALPSQVDPSAAAPSPAITPERQSGEHRFDGDTESPRGG